MKKFLFMCFLSSSLLAFQPGDIIFEPRLGIGTNFVLQSKDFDFEGYTTFGLETYYKYDSVNDIGLGIMYHSIATTKTNDDGSQLEGSISRIPIYLTAKNHWFEDWYVNVYTKFIIGYQFVLNTDFEEFNNGKYLGLGGGLNIMNFNLESLLILDTNDQLLIDDSDNRYSLGFNITVGYRF